MIKIKMVYKTKGVARVIYFNSTSRASLLNCQMTLGVPNKIEKIIRSKSFQLLGVSNIDVDILYSNDEIFGVFTGFGISCDAKHTFLHFKICRIK